jgi:hypothetical protein
MLAPLVARIVALVAVVGGVWYFLAGSRPPQAAHLSIVVLPFANLSGDPAEDYFADGVTENLTTDLSRIRNSFGLGLGQYEAAFRENEIDGDCLKIGGQAAFGTGADESLAGWNFCP